MLNLTVQYPEKHGSTSYITAAVMPACGHPGLEIRTLTTVLYTEQHSEVHKGTPTCRGCTHVTMYARHKNQLTWLETQTHFHIFESSNFEGPYVGDLLDLCSTKKRDIWKTPTRLHHFLLKASRGVPWLLIAVAHPALHGWDLVSPLGSVHLTEHGSQIWALATETFLLTRDHILGQHRALSNRSSIHKWTPFLYLTCLSLPRHSNLKSCVT